MGPESSTGPSAAAAAAVPSAEGGGRSIGSIWPDAVWDEIADLPEPLSWNEVQQIAPRICRQIEMPYTQSKANSERWQSLMEDIHGPVWKKEVAARRRREKNLEGADAGHRSEAGSVVSPEDDARSDGGGSQGSVLGSLRGGVITPEILAAGAGGIGSPPRSPEADDGDDLPLSGSIRDQLYTAEHSETGSELGKRQALNQEILLGQGVSVAQQEQYVLSEYYVRQYSKAYCLLEERPEDGVSEWAQQELLKLECRDEASLQSLVVRAKGLQKMAGRHRVDLPIKEFIAAHRESRGEWASGAWRLA